MPQGERNGDSLNTPFLLKCWVTFYAMFLIIIGILGGGISIISKCGVYTTFSLIFLLICDVDDLKLWGIHNICSLKKRIENDANDLKFEVYTTGAFRTFLIS